MSRIGKNPVTIPAGVTVEINDNSVTVKGKKWRINTRFFRGNDYIRRRKRFSRTYFRFKRR
jgi:ribosomal protein L6P/L9E